MLSQKQQQKQNPPTTKYPVSAAFRKSKLSLCMKYVNRHVLKINYQRVTFVTARLGI